MKQRIVTSHCPQDQIRKLNLPLEPHIYTSPNHLPLHRRHLHPRVGGSQTFGMHYSSRVLRIVRGRELPLSSLFYHTSNWPPRSSLAICLSQLMTAQLEATTAHQAIPVPICAGQTVTAFAVRDATLFFKIHVVTSAAAYKQNRLGLTTVMYGPPSVTAMAPYIHSIYPLPMIFCQSRVIYCNIHGTEDTTLNLGSVYSRS
jgi:hypothetical protein